MQVGLNLIAQAGGFFYTHAGTSPEVQANQARIDGREEIFSEHEDPAQREHAEGKKTGREELAVFDGDFQELIVAIAEVLEATLEAALKTPQKCLWAFGLMFVPAHDVHDQRRDQGSGEKIRGQHGED